MEDADAESRKMKIENKKFIFNVLGNMIAFKRVWTVIIFLYVPREVFINEFGEIPPGLWPFEIW